MVLALLLLGAAEPVPLARSTTPKRSTRQVEPPVTRMGSDRSVLPERYPEGDWLPIELPLMSMQVVVTAHVEGRAAKAILDTGASTTVMSRPLAESLGLLSADREQGTSVRVYDAHGDVVDGVRVVVDTLVLGHRVFPDARVAVLGDHPSLFLIGADLLEQVDLFLAGEEGLVGLFNAGQAPVPTGSREVTLVQGRHQLRVVGAAPNVDDELVDLELILDTGASQTAVPTHTGVTRRLPADIRYRQITSALGGDLENRGRFLLDPLQLGPQKVGVPRVLANPSVMEGGRGNGLLGNDVLMRQHAVISFSRGKLWLGPIDERPASRSRGPENRRCLDRRGQAASCISVAVVKERPTVRSIRESLEDRCLRVDVHKNLAGRTLELILTASANDGAPLFAGGALRVYATVGDDGFTGCFALWRALASLGLDEKTRLSLRWVRSEGMTWPCDPMRTECISFTGPLAVGIE